MKPKTLLCIIALIIVTLIIFWGSGAWSEVSGTVVILGAVGFAGWIGGKG